MVLTPDSYSYDMWKELPMPMYMSLYFFNVTNSDDIENRVPGVKPKLEEVGPYVYRQYQFMNVSSWNDDNDTVTYMQNKYWTFQPMMSKGTLDDIIVSINVIALGATEYARIQPSSFNALEIRDMFDQIDAQLFLKYPVRNYTFDGISDEIMEATKTFPGSIPLPIPFDKFGWFYERNQSLDYDGVYNMYTGNGDFDQVGQIALWNEDSQVPADMYTGYCGQINGSAGEFFPPNRDKTFVNLFTSDLCRSIRFTFEKETKVKGVSGYKYTLDSALVDNSLPENQHSNAATDQILR